MRSIGFPAGNNSAPASAASALTGASGALALVGASIWLRDWLQPNYIKALAVLAIAAAAMTLVELVVYRVHRNAGTGLSQVPLRRIDLHRIGRKLIGFWLCCGLAGALYWMIPAFAEAFFQPFRKAALFLLPGLVAVAPFYVAYVDRRQHDPEDAYAQLGSLILGATSADWAALSAHMRGWAIKAFFLPLMFVFVTNDLSAFWSRPLLPTPLDFEHAFFPAISALYLIDVSLAAIAYTLTLRILDSHIRSAEPTVGGWVVCLICYTPFNTVTGRFLPYDQDGLYWNAVFAPWPLLYVLWGSAILLLVAVYAWSTAAFGLRFSNLTNRGIITAGPYRWSKHPAYISKNLSWWMISVPFIAGAGWPQAIQSCLLLGCVNLIYFARARTEERHLRADPAYVAYSDFISRRGLIALARSAVAEIGARAHRHWLWGPSLGRSRERVPPDSVQGELEPR